MPKLTINGKEIEVAPGSTILQACEEAGVEIPRFCYHERLSVAGNCRMCLVEVKPGPPKPQASCALPAADGQEVRTDSPMVKKAREGVLEFLLINHPLDCPICDQGGECDLQDETMAYGRGAKRYDENKRAVAEKNMGPLVKTIMTRCIHCTRCIRFSEEVAGVTEIGAIYRGENMQITTYLEQAMESELQGNVIDLCPVGALTSKPYAFNARPWELIKTESIDVMDAVGSNIRIDARGRDVMRILPRNHDDVNEEWISDKTRFACDGLLKGRLDRPYVKRDGKLVEASWAEAFAAIKDGISGLDGSQIAGLVGDLNELEGTYAFRELLKNLGSSRIECRQNGAAYDIRQRASYLFNTGIAGIEEADFCLLVGANPRHEAAILNARILKATRHRGLKVANIGPALDQTYAVEQLGDDAAILSDILAGKHPVAKKLAAADRPMIILGEQALARPDGAAILKAGHDIAEKFGLMSLDWNGFNVLHSAAARVGALDLGLVCDGGVEGILADAASGTLKAVFLLGADEINPSRLADCFTVYIGSHGDHGVQQADVILPAAAYSEKPGHYLNLEGRVQLANRAVFPPGQAREDWTIFRALSAEIGPAPLPFDSIDALLSALYEVLPHLADVDVRPQAQWDDFGSDGAIARGPIPLKHIDFYQSNPIARASKTMAECSAVKRQKMEATGTHG
ncbi:MULTISPECIES: NADH-quinone oxidoreductase subunit NuoG [unclassified Iodidimonas]|jgi:NADH-quinone oxidoreductase subunit G|uniref:NADH-quinone oxidoreductase subunit NuoG n=1 Tax=unclassified Iodidimonas TaxID=2626145 RepID=UPI002482FE6B|nr:MULTISPECIES: NADH-quinone oxidoreductase subunit NuoG [unclassified Iodidimonas]